MECLHAAEILSAHHDGFPVDAALLAEATQHCESCVECAAFAAALPRLDALPHPAAPPELVARLVSMSAEAARPPRAVVQSSVRRTWPRLVSAASAAAVLLVALAVGGTLVGRLGTQQSETASSERSGETPLAGSSKSAEDAAVQDTAAPAAVEAPLELITFDGVVWSRSTASLPESGRLVLAGTVTSDLGTGVVRARGASYAAGDATVLYVESDGGDAVAFTRVVRTLGGLPYALVSEAPLDRFGELPSLPGRFGTPAPDGSPTFTAAGTDDVRVTVYTPLGASTREGFALAPNASSAIPIGVPTLPVWTWWTPVAAVPPAR